MTDAWLVRDLTLLGMTLVAPIEDCHCASCQSLDRRFDVDVLATLAEGSPRFIAWRRQPEYDMRTITIRASNDNGNDDVQLAKLIDGRSRADVYVQSYPSGIAWAFTGSLRATLRGTFSCSAHKESLSGSGGQVFRVVCGACSGVTYVSRDKPESVPPKGRNPDGTWGELGWFTEALYREWGP